jgi:hypothetical protein
LQVAGLGDFIGERVRIDGHPVLQVGYVEASDERRTNKEDDKGAGGLVTGRRR